MEILSARRPSNIAFVKYWGKKEQQCPLNPSISMTLTESYTESTLEVNIGEGNVSLQFDGKQDKKFGERTQKWIDFLSEKMPQLKSYDYVFKSRNSFPHSTGIASSASAFATHADLLGQFLKKNNLILTLDQISEMARLGSGSACRSFWQGFVEWGYHSDIEGSSDNFGRKIHDVHHSFNEIHDTILVVSSKPKAVSSSTGHALMKDHFLKEARLKQANDNLLKTLTALKNGDWKTLGNVIEMEALTLHALMMTSSSSYILMEPNSLKIIQKVRSFREDTDLPLYFTLDAGPNLHLIYPALIKNQVKDFILMELKKFLENEDSLIWDKNYV